MPRATQRFWSICLTLLLVISTLTGCANYEQSMSNETSSPASHTYFIFDTVVTLRVFEDGMTDSNFAEVEDILMRIDREMNRQKIDSELSGVNREAGIRAMAVSEETFHVIRAALHYASASGGKFEPTIGPLVDLWGIGQEGAAVPDAGLLTEALQLIDYKQVDLDEAALTVKLEQEGMSLDLGAIAKGYAADAIAQYLTEKGFNSALIDLGGNILAMGAKPGGLDWTIGIQAPELQRGQHLGRIKVQNKTVVTSGVYERFFEENGVLYHHILDPLTGYPVANDLLSVTIVTDESMMADALSTAVFSLGLEGGLRFVAEYENVEAIFITKDRNIYLSEGLIGKFELTNDEYRLAE